MTAEPSANAGRFPARRQKQALLGGLLAVSLALVAAAQRDLHGRPDNEVRGSRRLWRALCLNALGALAYFAWGRRTDT